MPLYRLLGLRPTGPHTSWTIWLGDPDDMARRAEAVAGRFRRLKLKLGGRDGLDVERVRAVRAVTDVPLQVDVNEYWSLEEARDALPQLAELGVEYCEQPLPAGDPGGPELRAMSPIPIYVDEDCHTLADVAACAERAHGINIKLAKSGGVREAVRMASAARALGLGVMLGCMLESGLGIAPAAHIASLCDHVDLDGNLLLRDDPWPGVRFEDGVQRPSGHARSGRVPGSDPRPRSDTEALRDPRRGLLRRPALREDGAGHPPLLAAPDRGDRRFDEGGGDDGRRARRRHDRRGARIPADDRRRRSRHAGRPLPAGVEGAPPRVHRGGPRRRERSARVPRRRRRAVGARAHSRRRAPRPAPSAEDVNVPTGANLEVDAKIVLTVGSDCAIGKKTVAVELDREARSRGLQSVFCPTGQTGIAIAGWGIAVDAVVADFIAGAAERIVVEGAERGGRLLFVEGQGSLVHPLYSGVTLGLLHGAAPHALVLCHKAGETEIEGCPGHPIPPLPELVELHERISLPATEVERRGDRAQHRRSRRGRCATRGGRRGGRDGPRHRRSRSLRVE